MEIRQASPEYLQLIADIAKNFKQINPDVNLGRDHALRLAEHRISELDIFLGNPYDYMSDGLPTENKEKEIEKRASEKEAWEMALQMVDGSSDGDSWRLMSHLIMIRAKEEAVELNKRPHAMGDDRMPLSLGILAHSLGVPEADLSKRR